MANQFGGTGVALVTPFKADFSVDFEGLGRLLEHTAATGGVDYWVVQGTTGESATLSASEKAEVLRFVVQNNPKKIPIVYGIGGNHTAGILETFKNTDLNGVAAILSVSPYYNKPSQEGIYEHYKLIADHSPLPIILYNVPGRTASNVSGKTTLRLASNPKILAMKEASGDLNQCIEIAKEKPADFALLSGDDMLTIPIISLGGEGVISVLANAFPVLFSGMTRAALQGDYTTANKNLHELFAINPLMYEESNPVGVKQALALLGICEPVVRLPLLAASASLKGKIERVMPKETSIA